MKALFHTIIARLHGFLRRRRLDSEFNHELETHLEMAAQDKIRRGMMPEEARRAARVELGGVTQLQEAGRAARGLPWLDSFGLDIRLGLRMMRKSWGMTLIGGLAMAVAISVGATTFAIYANEGNTLPLDEGDRLVRLLGVGRNGGFTSVHDFEWWRQRMQSVEDISAFRTVEDILAAEDGSVGQVSVAQMTSSGFRVARVQPLIGRPLLEEDERAGAPPVVVIGYDIWQSRFAGDRAAIGKTLQLGGVERVVIGIMPEDFAFPVNHRVWIPFGLNPLSDARPANANIGVFGRLAPGVTIERAEAEIAVVGPAPGDPQANQERRTSVERYAASFGPGLTGWPIAIPVLLALLLVPPCANIAILIYARNVSREGEFAARYVLGAGRGRIVGQLLIEAFVLAAASGTVGLMMAHQFLKEFRRLVDQDPNFAFWMKPNLSFETVLYVAALAMFAAMIAGGLPALRATGRMRNSAFQAMGSRTSARLGMTWTVLVVTQVALSTAVLPQAGELIWMLLHPNIIGREFAAEEYVTARIALEDERPDRFRDLQTELVRQVQSALGVSGATVSASIDGIHEAFGRIEMDAGTQESIGVVSNHVDEAYFDVFKASRLAGRGFETADFNPGRPVVIVNRTFAEQLFGQNPLGKRLRYLSRGDRDSEPWYEIVGLVDEISSNTPRNRVYHAMSGANASATARSNQLMPPPQIRQVSLTLHVGPIVPTDFTRRLLEITTAVDRNLHVEEIRTLADMYQQELRDDNVLGLSVATIVLVVVLFTAAGIHTLVAFSVAQRRREIGIRSALGAPPLRLVAGIFRRDLSPVVAGAVVGILLAFPVDKLVLSSNGASSVTTFSASAALLFMIAVGLIAVAGPSRRLLRVDSTEALRES